MASQKIKELAAQLRVLLNFPYQFLLNVLVATANLNQDLQIGFRDDNVDVITDLSQGYGSSSEGYMNMHWDQRRNKYFQTTLSRFSSAVGGSSKKRKAATIEEPDLVVNNWLEVGPGAVGTLTMMVLKDPQARVTAVEANREAALFLRKRPEVREAMKDRRLQIYEGPAGVVDVPASERFDGVVAEVLGHWGSSEGFVHILWLLGRRYMDQLVNLRVVVPPVFGTAVVPIDIGGIPEGQKFVVSSLGSRVVLVQNFPFAAASLDVKYNPPFGQLGRSKSHKRGSLEPLPAGHGILELYDSMSIVKAGATDSEEIHQFNCEWVVKSEGILDSLASYVVYGDSVDGPYMRSTEDIAGRSGWCTVLIPLGFEGGPCRCSAGDKIIFKSACSVMNQAAASYEFNVVVETEDGSCKATVDINIEYKDLVCVRHPLKQVLKDNAAA